MDIPFMDLKVQYQAIKEEVDRAIFEVIENTQFIMGEQVADFEREFAEFCEAKYAVGASSGTTELHLALLACDIQAGEEVLTTPHTFIATIEAISHIGAYPVFVDVNERDYNIDTNKLAEFIDSHCEYDAARGGLINRRTNRLIRAVIPVHLYGHPADMEPVLALAEKYGLRVIEDVAQAHGARYKGIRVGAIGDVGCFSFFPGKNLGAFGDGGMLVTNNEEIAEKSRLLANHGRKDKYRHLIIGYNYRLDALQAAILRVKLKFLDDWSENRRKRAAQYNKLLPEALIPEVRAYAEHVYHLYVINTDRRDELQAFLTKQGIKTGVHYPIPLHLQPAYSFLGYKPGDFPIAEACAGQVLSLPMYPELPLQHIEYVADTINTFFGANG